MSDGTRTAMAESRGAAAPSALAGLAPAYFGMVMATGIVSIAAQLMGLPILARGLFALNLLAYAVLWALNVLRAFRHRQRFFDRHLLEDARQGGEVGVAAAPRLLR